MALSNSEHTLLVSTCENMNVAAETCRQVLDMLRSLGASGVVDIATHNNATEVHANAANLAHIKTSDKSLRLGENGSTAPVLWPMFSPIDLLPESRAIMMLYETKGDPRSPNRISSYVAATNSSGELVELSTIGEGITHTRIESIVFGLNNGTTVNYTSGMFTTFGDPSHAGNGLYSSINFYGGNGAGGGRRLLHVSSDVIYTPETTPTLGYSTSSFDTIYLVTAPTITSDRRQKTSVNAIDSKAVDFIKGLRPVQFTLKEAKRFAVESDENGNGAKYEAIPGTRTHWGLIAQEVQEALVSAGYDPSACAVWSLADKNDPDSKQALRYEELIAPMIKVIQQQQERIEALERKVA